MDVSTACWLLQINFPILTHRQLKEEQKKREKELRNAQLLEVS